MKKWIRSIVTLSTLTAAMTVGLATHAEPLPVPSEPQVVVLVPPVMLLSPPNGVEGTYNTVFTWSHNDEATSYKLKVKLLETGQTLSSTVDPASCNGAGFCTRTADAIDLFDHVEDGDTAEWWVIVKYGDAKAKSSRRTLVINSVSAPSDLSPSYGGWLTPSGALAWNDAFENMTYTLIVKHAETGALVHKSTIHAYACGPICEVNPFEGMAFPNEEAFEWRVKAKGYNGDKAKTPTRLFQAALAAVALN
jgi:hypothetical protein